SACSFSWRRASDRSPIEAAPSARAIGTASAANAKIRHGAARRASGRHRIAGGGGERRNNSATRDDQRESCTSTLASSVPVAPVRTSSQPSAPPSLRNRWRERKNAVTGANARIAKAHDAGRRSQPKSPRAANTKIPAKAKPTAACNDNSPRNSASIARDRKRSAKRRTSPWL